MAMGTNDDKVGGMIAGKLDDFIGGRPLDVKGQDIAGAEFLLEGIEPAPLGSYVRGDDDPHAEGAGIVPDKFRLGLGDVDEDDTAVEGIREGGGGFDDFDGDIREVDGDEDGFHGVG